MKKILAFALALLMVSALVSCGNGNTNTNPTSENENGEGQQTSTDNGQTADAAEETADAGEETADADEHPVLKMCGLDVEDIKAGVGAALGDTVIETESQFVCTVSCPEASFDKFESWLTALADNCRKAAKDGKLYESEMSEEECTSFDLDPDALMNVVTFIYRTSNKVVYVNASYAVTGNDAFGCNIQVY